MNRTDFLRQQTISGENKIERAPLSLNWSVSEENLSLPERKSLGLKMILDNMPLFIGEQELIVGTRTIFRAVEGNEDGHDRNNYSLNAGVPYVNRLDIELFGTDQSYKNKTHYTPDYGIILELGIDGIINKAKSKLDNVDLNEDNIAFLKSVIIAYNGLKSLVNRYSEYAFTLASEQDDCSRKKELENISKICADISHKPAESLYQAVQLLWFAHLTSIIESFEFINYGRLDVILYKYLRETDRSFALQLIECLLLKMYDQVDIATSYLGKYAAQLVVTLGGVLPNGENAVNEVSFLFLGAIEKTNLPDPEFNLRINSKNPPEFLSKACELTTKGYNFISYYNDDLFIESMINAGVDEEIANDYSFDLCQDITFAGKGELWLTACISLTHRLMEFLKQNQAFNSFEDLLTSFKAILKNEIKNSVDKFNRIHTDFLEYKKGNRDYFFNKLKKGETYADFYGRSLMAPLPYLSGLFHSAIEDTADMTLESYPVKHKGIIIGSATETINSLAAIKKVVYDIKQYTLKEVFNACETNFEAENGEIIRNILWNAPKWGNDDDYVDLIGKDILEFCLKEILKYNTVSGGRQLAGIHQPHPVPTGAGIMATPEGRKKGLPVAVTLSPENGTMKNGPTAALKSATKIDYKLIQWNFCIMINYFASVFKGNDGSKIFENLLKSYFKIGGLQHQPQVLDVDELIMAQLNPEKYKDLIVRLWGVSAHFVDLPKELQEEIIARYK